MADGIYRLIYYSRNHIARDEGAFATDIEEILEKSRANNRRDKITGALLFNGGCFAQVLEGPLSKLEAAFERIQQDERHGDVSVLALDQIDHRSFPNWAMSFIGISDVHGKRFAGIGVSSGFDPARLGGDAIYLLLKELAIEEEDAA